MRSEIAKLLKKTSKASLDQITRFTLEAVENAAAADLKELGIMVEQEMGVTASKGRR